VKALIVALFLLASGARTVWAGEQWPPDEFTARITYYVQRGVMASGLWTRKDAAACSKWLPFGTQLRFPDGYVVTCLDRGHGDWYWPAWVDVHAESMAWGLRYVEADYGLYSRVSVIRWGWGE
jgi:hypothetical protein